MHSPLDPLVATLVNKFDANLRETFEERAGIIEFDAQVPRAHAECLALLNVLHRYPAALTGVAALQFELQGKKPCFLTTNPGMAHQRLAAMGAVDRGVIDLGEVVQGQYGGLARLEAV